MTTHSFIRTSLCAALILAGCASPQPPRIKPSVDTGPKRQLDLARAFETGSDLRRAIYLYQMIATDNTRSPVTIEATRKAAVLTGSVRNPERSDSLSLQWFKKYLSLPITPAERENAELCISLLDRVLTQQRHGMYYAAKADSLQEVIRHLGTALVSQSQRVLELERETRNANAEVKRMKDIDVRLSQSRRRR
jgi:hypothetical protein